MKHDTWHGNKSHGYMVHACRRDASILCCLSFRSTGVRACYPWLIDRVTACVLLEPTLCLVCGKFVYNSRVFTDFCSSPVALFRRRSWWHFLFWREGIKYGVKYRSARAVLCFAYISTEWALLYVVFSRRDQWRKSTEYGINISLRTQTTQDVSVALRTLRRFYTVAASREYEHFQTICWLLGVTRREALQ